MNTCRFSEITSLDRTGVGIYCIRYDAGSKKYVGQTKHKEGFFGRFEDHRDLLRAGIHDNIYLQRSYDKHGEESFYFEILERCDKNDLFAREKFWIEKLQSMYDQDGWNLQTIDDQLKRVSFSPRRDKNLFLIHESGETFFVKSQKEFCQKYNLDSACVCRLFSKKLKSYRGWRILNEEKLCKYIFKHISGKVENIYCVKEFLIENGLNSNQFQLLTSGKRSEILGWSCQDIFLNRKYYERKIISPDGKIVIFNDALDLCKISNLKPHNITAVVGGQVRESNGWKNIEKSIVIKNLISGEVACFTSHTAILKFMKIHRKTLKKFLKNQSSSSRFKLESIDSLPIVRLDGLTITPYSAPDIE